MASGAKTYSELVASSLPLAIFHGFRVFRPTLIIFVPSGMAGLVLSRSYEGAEGGVGEGGRFLLGWSRARFAFPSIALCSLLIYIKLSLLLSLPLEHLRSALQVFRARL